MTSAPAVVEKNIKIATAKLDHSDHKNYNDSALNFFTNPLRHCYKLTI